MAGGVRGDHLGMWFVTQGPVMLWVYRASLGLVWGQMSCSLSEVGRRWPWSRGTERNVEGSGWPGHELPR